jgi:hypothetical protein
MPRRIMWSMVLAATLCVACAPAAEEEPVVLDGEDDVAFTTEESTSDRVCSYTTTPCGAYGTCFYECTGTVCGSDGRCYRYSEIGCYVCGGDPPDRPPPRDPPPYET